MNPLELARQRAKELRAEGGTIERVDPIEKARRKPTSLRLAITAKCWDCVGGDADPLTRRRIRECSCAGCPLHPVRPFQAKA